MKTKYLKLPFESAQRVKKLLPSKYEARIFPDIIDKTRISVTAVHDPAVYDDFNKDNTTAVQSVLKAVRRRNIGSFCVALGFAGLAAFMDFQYVIGAVLVPTLVYVYNKAEIQHVYDNAALKHTQFIHALLVAHSYIAESESNRIFTEINEKHEDNYTLLHEQYTALVEELTRHDPMLALRCVNMGREAVGLPPQLWTIDTVNRH